MDAPRQAGPTLAVLALVAASPGALAGAPASDGGGELDCGALAPILNACVDCCALLTEDPRLAIEGLGFEGRLTAWLHGPNGNLTWECEVLLLHPLLTTCTGPVLAGTMVPGETVSLSCRARPASVAGLLLGPAGPWSCRVENLA